jgi:putative Ca2+/H+ antiporter (TMEM165/GDT1 family)
LTPGKEGSVNWNIFGSTLVMIFLAELGDKTQLATLSFAAKSKSSVSVFLGASAALILTTLIATLLGDLVGRYVPQHYIRYAAGIVFVAFGGFMLLGK